MTITQGPQKLAVFDCDGTLIDSQAAICDAMEAGFAAAGLSAPDRNIVRRMVGLSLPIAMRRLAPDASESQCSAAVAAYKDSFFSARTSGSLEEPLYDGIKEVLDKLSGSGWDLAVATGKSDRGLNACLAHHGIADLFVSLQTADRHPSKPDPAMLAAAMFEAGAKPAETVMIGDTVFDIEMARAAGVRPIGVAWGYHEPEEMLSAGAEAVAASMSALEAMLLD